MTPSEIDHLDPRKYRKIYYAIRASIDSGDIAPGTRIPSIADLTVTYGVSRGTASRTLRDLVSDGLITRYPGHGYFATAPTTPAPGGPSRSRDKMTAGAAAPRPGRCPPRTTMSPTIVLPSGGPLPTAGLADCLARLLRLARERQAIAGHRDVVPAHGTVRQPHQRVPHPLQHQQVNRWPTPTARPHGGIPHRRGQAASLLPRLKIRPHQ